VPVSLLSSDPTTVFLWNSETQSYENPGSLSEFTGYWVYSPTTRVVRLKQARHIGTLVGRSLVPALEGGGAPSGMIRPPAKPDWTAALRLEVENGPSRTVELGISKDSAVGYDRLDMPQPPMPAGTFSAFYATVNDLARRLTRSLQPLDGASAEWTLVAQLPQPGALRWKSASLPRGYQLMLDAPDGERDLSQPGEAHLDAGRHEIRVRLLWNAPSASRLLANYPNPFNPETWIPFELKEASDVRLQIYDATGDRVRTFDLGPRPAGYYTSRTEAVYWDGRNALGERVASGVYFYEIQAGGYREMRRMVILK
jgi:hypothetical protein